MDWDPTYPLPDDVYFIGFNSPVGIRWIGTICIQGVATDVGRFQFPSRNSMDWDVELPIVGGEVALVSIPQSEFDGLGRVLQVPS